MLIRHRSSEDAGLIKRVQLTVQGLVQDVGFRPYVFSLAKRRALSGQVRNTTTGVQIDVEGDGRAIECFIDDLRANSPPLALVDSVKRRGDWRLLSQATPAWRSWARRATVNQVIHPRFRTPASIMSKSWVPVKP